MGKAIGGSLPLAVGIALSPIPIIAVVLMLTSHRAKVNGPAFVAGWLLGLGIVGAIVLSLAGPAGASKSGSPAAGVGWDKVRRGVLAGAGGGPPVPLPATRGRTAADAQMDDHDRQDHPGCGGPPGRRHVRRPPKEPASRS